MGSGLLAKLKTLPRRAGERPEHAASLLLPVLIIIIGMSVLAWRSYVLSVRTERGTAVLAKQYAAYAADITARRLDNAVRNEITRASEDWQQVERRPPITWAALSAIFRMRRASGRKLRPAGVSFTDRLVRSSNAASMMCSST